MPPLASDPRWHSAGASSLLTAATLLRPGSVRHLHPGSVWLSRLMTIQPILGGPIVSHSIMSSIAIWRHVSCSLAAVRLAIASSITNPERTALNLTKT